MTFRMVRSFARYSVWISPCLGSRSPVKTDPGSDTARATTSRTELSEGSWHKAARQSEINRSSSNIRLPLRRILRVFALTRPSKNGGQVDRQLPTVRAATVFPQNHRPLSGTQARLTGRPNPELPGRNRQGNAI